MIKGFMRLRRIETMYFPCSSWRIRRSSGVLPTGYEVFPHGYVKFLLCSDDGNCSDFVVSGTVKIQQEYCHPVPYIFPAGSCVFPVGNGGN